MRKVIFSVEQEKAIIEFYLQPNSLLDTAKFAGIKNISIIKTVLSKYNIPVHSKAVTVALQQQKAKETFLNKYGNEYIIASEYARNKAKKSLFDHYGVDNSFKASAVKQKISKTLFLRYKVQHALQLTDFKQKAKETSQQKYGAFYYNQSAEARVRNNNLFGVDFYTQTEAFKQKRLVSLKKHHTFNSSKLEEQFYKKLAKIYKNTKRQYHDTRYPFACDFYIPELDLFIELNLTWTHGGQPFSNSKQNLKKLTLWEQKAKTSTYYKNAIKVWTKTDPLKIQIANQNNLNYICLYTWLECKQFLANLVYNIV